MDILGLVAVVGFGAGFSRRMEWSEPLVVIAAGIGLSFVPGVLEIQRRGAA